MKGVMKCGISASVPIWIRFYWIGEFARTEDHPANRDGKLPLIQLYNKKTPQFYKILNCKGLEYLGPESNRHWHLYANWILSPTRLPIPPPRQKLIRQVVVSNLRSAIYGITGCCYNEESYFYITPPII